MTKLDWEVNIENLAKRVAASLGREVVAATFARYGASGVYDLNPSYYSDVFGELMQMDED